MGVGPACGTIEGWYTAGCDAGLRSTAAAVLCLSDSLHFTVHGAGNQPQKGVYSALRGTVVKGGVEYDLDKAVVLPVWYRYFLRPESWLLDCAGSSYFAGAVMNAVFWAMEPNYSLQKGKKEPKSKPDAGD